MTEEASDILVIFSPPGEADFFQFIPDQTGAQVFHFVPWSAPHPSFHLQGHVRPAGRMQLDQLKSPELACPSPGSDRSSYLASVRSARKAMTEGALDKVVLSTVTPCKPQGSLAELLQKLRDKHPQAFVYCFAHHTSGTWVGASPEPLLISEAGEATTVSLAGTRLHEQQIVPWGQKESLEQSIVTDYIKATLHQQGVERLRIDRPETVQYGNIEHLRSTLRFFTDAPLKVAEALHPTPAVCGTPMKEAREEIAKLEAHDRMYYTGFVGLTEGINAQLFVNLRCLQCYADALLVYTGGGITFESDPEDEWEETRNKLKAFLPEDHPLEI